jgi:hypothetical protein
MANGHCRRVEAAILNLPFRAVISVSDATPTQFDAIESFRSVFVKCKCSKTKPKTNEKDGQDDEMSLGERERDTESCQVGERRVNCECHLKPLQ